MATSSPYGVTVPLFSTNLYAYSSQLFPDCATIGIKAIRVQMSWFLIEGSAGAYNWAALDDFVGRCNAAGIFVQFPIRQAPTWHTTTLVNPSQTNHTTCNSNWPNDKIYQMDAAAAGTFAGIVAKRYNGRTTPNAHQAGSFLYLDAIEIGNEDFDDLFDCNSPTTVAGQEPRLAKWYAPVIFAAAPAIRANSPTTLIGMFGMWWSNIDHRTSFLTDLYTLKDSGGKSAAAWLDYFNFHCYIGDPTVDVSPTNPSLSTVLSDLNAIVTGNGDNKHFRITEIGWSIREISGSAGDPTAAQEATYYQSAMDTMRTSGIVDGFNLFSMSYNPTGSIVTAGDSIVQPAGLTPHFWPAATTIQSYAVAHPTWTTPPPSATLGAAPATLAFRAVAGSSNPAAQSVTLTWTGASSTTYTASDSAPWLAESPTSGSIAAGGTATAVVSVDITGLAAGTYTAAATWTTAGGATASATVTLTVSTSTPPPPTGALTAYFSSAASTLILTANQLYSALGTPTNTNIDNALGRATGWGEIVAQGTAAPWAGAAAIGGASGYGFLWGARTLENNDLQPGTYTAALRLNITGTGAVSITADLHVRLWKWSAAAGYSTLVADCVLAAQTILTTKTTFHPTVTTTAPTSFASGDKLYIEIKVNVTANTNPSTANITLSDLSTDTAGQTGLATAQVVTPGYAPTPAGPPPPPPPAPLTIYGTTGVDSALATACDLTTATGGAETSVTNTTTGTNQTVEIRSQGATGATGRTTGIPAVPTGNGWVYDPGPGTIAAGAWSASVTMSASSWSGSSSTTQITLRAFSVHAGTYTLIGAWAPVGITGVAKTTYSVPATAFGGVSLAEGDFVYLDLWWQNTGAGGIGGNNPVVYVSATAAGVASDLQVGLPTFTPAPVVPPPTGLPLTLTISGVPVTPVGTTLSAKSTVGRRGELVATVFDPSGARHLQQYQQVALVDQDGTLAFTGYITSPVETKPGFSALLVTQFTATDQHYLADKRIVAKFYRNQTVEYMVNDLSTSILQGEGVSIGQITPTGVTVPIANFGYVTVADALDALVAAASSTGIPYYWMIDQNKALWVVPYATLTGPAVDGTLIDDGRLSGQVPTVTRANPKYRNTQYAVGGVKETGANDETRAGDGQTRTFPFSYALNAAPTTFTLNGTAKSLGVKGQTGYSYYHAVGDNTIVQDSGQTLLTSTDRLRMVYVGQVPAVFTAQNAAQVAAQAALDGTSGIIEAVLTDKTIGSQAQGTLEVGQELTRYCLAGTKFVFATKAGGFAPGQQITVTYAPFGFAGAQMLVTEVDLTDQQDGTMIWYSITAVQGPYDTTWVEFFGNLLKPQNYQLASNISLGVSLNSPLLPSTTTYPSPTLYPQD